MLCKTLLEDLVVLFFGSFSSTYSSWSFVRGLMIDDNMWWFLILMLLKLLHLILINTSFENIWYMTPNGGNSELNICFYKGHVLACTTIDLFTTWPKNVKGWFGQVVNGQGIRQYMGSGFLTVITSFINRIYK